MAIYGDGSDGALNVTGGTYNLNLNQKYQFTTVNVSAGAVLSTNSTQGSVLYILAKDSVTINGDINLYGKLDPGNFTTSWGVTIDGDTYNAPGTGIGGYGAAFGFFTPVSQTSGFGQGGGGAAAAVQTHTGGVITADGGAPGGTGNTPIGSGGSGTTAEAYTDSEQAVNGGSGGVSAGGGGGAAAMHKRVTGPSYTGYTFSGNSGSGGGSYGANGQDASSNGYWAYLGGSGSGSYSFSVGGGGGAGGSAGRAGIHLVIKSPTIIINGQIFTGGTAGQNGGNGGRNYDVSGWTNTWGMGAGGGGGGRGGDIKLFYGASLTDTSTKNQAGGSGGTRGNGGVGFTPRGQNGASGANGSFSSSMLAPITNFTSNVTSGNLPLAVQFTNTSEGGTSWLWNFGDGNTSTSQNPLHTYLTVGSFNVSLTVTNSAGSDNETKNSYITTTPAQYFLSINSSNPSIGDSNLISESSFLSIDSLHYATGRGIVLTNYQALAQKDYEYRVYDHNDNFIAIWKNVVSQFSYNQTINQNATELNVRIARSPNNLSVGYSALLDNNGQEILDNNSSVILVPTETSNAVGEGTDIDLNYNVEVLAFYGGYEPLLDEFSDPILDNLGEQILVPFGFPNGKPVYRGYISDYTLNYGGSVGVDVVVVPHATEMNHHVFKSGLATTVSYGSSTDPVQMARDAMDQYIANGGKVTYLPETMPLTGESAPYEFNLQTTREVVDKSVDLLPSGFYQFVDPGETTQYLLEKSATPHHVFYYENHITTLQLRKSITQLVNEVYFVGGNISPPDTSEENLFKYLEDGASISTIRPGLERLSDSRVTTDLGAQILAQNKINDFKEPRYRTQVTISDGTYDIETIKLGQMVGFKNFGSFVDNLVLQIVTIQRQKHSVTLDLDMSIPGEAKRLEEIKKALLSQDVSNIPSTPS